jgi:hypothetical protein
LETRSDGTGDDATRFSVALLLLAEPVTGAFAPPVERRPVLEFSGRRTHSDARVGDIYAVKNRRRLPVGSFIVISAGLPHFGIVEEDTLIQAHGPWQTTYVNERP